MDDGSGSGSNYVEDGSGSGSNYVEVEVEVTMWNK